VWDSGEVECEVCSDNSGDKTCNGSNGADYSENGGSLNISLEAVTGTDRGKPGFNNLLERGYTVRVGTGTARNNIARSNAWTSHWSTAVHIPVHSNADSPFTCTSTTTSGKGTVGMYNNTATSYGKPGTAGKELADILWKTTVGPASPGTSDQGVK
jgi:hypothetical protein